MKTKEFIKRLNNCSIFWSNKDQRYTIERNRKQVYDTETIEQALNHAKTVTR